jgi:hypothetical protein
VAGLGAVREKIPVRSLTGFFYIGIDKKSNQVLSLGSKISSLKEDYC